MDNTNTTLNNLDFLKRIRKDKISKKELKACKEDLIKKGYTGSLLTKKD